MLLRIEYSKMLDRYRTLSYRLSSLKIQRGNSISYLSLLEHMLHSAVQVSLELVTACLHPSSTCNHSFHSQAHHYLSF